MKYLRYSYQNINYFQFTMCKDNACFWLRFADSERTLTLLYYFNVNNINAGGEMKSTYSEINDAF